MAGKKRPLLNKALINLVLLVPTLFSLARKIISLLGLEARLAGRSFIIIIMLLMIIGTVFTATWLCLLTMLFFYFTSLHLSVQLSLLFLVVINLLMIVLVGLLILKFKKNLFFPATRRQIKTALKINEHF